MKTAKLVAAAREQIEVGWGGRQANAELRRTHRRILRVEVQPSGDVVVIAPFRTELDEIRVRLKNKGPWIFREIDRVLSRSSVTPERRFVSGETHLLLGRQYRLSIEQCDEPQVRVGGSRLNVFARRIDDQAHCRRLIEAFYMITARRVFSQRLDELFPLFMRRGMAKPPLIVRRMAKRWGSYTPKGRIVLNVELVRASPMLIDYVICHELAHGFFPDHGKDWRHLFDMVMPDWEIRKARLERALR